MAEVWLLEAAKGIGRMFLNPVLYFSFILAVAAGYMRVKRERKDFHIRINRGLHELRHLLPAGLLAGLILSIIAVGTGFILPLPVIAAIAAVTIVLALAGNARLLSPAYTVGVALLLVFGADVADIHIPFFLPSSETIEPIYLVGTAMIIGVLLLTEGTLMLKNGLIDLSPKLRTSRRGLTVGAHQTKRLWLIPIFFLLPAGPITSAFEWWPVIQWGTQSYALILVPFLMGFQHQIQATLPEEAVYRLARQVIVLGFIITAAAVGSLWLPASVSLLIAAAAIGGRAWISYRHRVREGMTPYYFTPLNDGVMILDVIPDSPADKMGLQMGEIIQSCNGTPLRNKQDLYEALLKNRAYCKLEVLDISGEIRLLQRALYEGDHHELGIIFVEKRMKRNQDKAV